MAELLLIESAATFNIPLTYLAVQQPVHLQQVL